MEKNQIIGFGLIFLILVGWSILNKPTEEEIQKAKEEQLAKEQRTQAEETHTAQVPIAVQQNIPDSIMQIQQVGQFGIFATAASGTSSTSVLENDLVKLTFDSKGGKIVNATFKEHYKTIYDADNKEVEKIPLE